MSRPRTARLHIQTKNALDSLGSLVLNTDMLNFVLFATSSLIWGSTWLAIKLQLTQVPPILSVAYRFCLASAVLLLFCRLTVLELFALPYVLFLVLPSVVRFHSPPV